MKKKIYLFIFLFCFSRIYSQNNYLFNFESFPIYKNDGGIIGKFFRPLPKNAQTPWKWEEDYEVFFSTTDFILDSGWKKLKKAYSEFSYYKDDNKYDTPFFIEGGGFALFFDSNTNYDQSNFRIDIKSYLSAVRHTVEVIEVYDYESYLKEKSTQDHSSISEIKNNIKTITESSFYIEKTKNGIYKYDSLMLPVLLNSELGHSCWIQHNPWVPGKDKNASGIGEYLEIEFTNKSDNIVVLNGYVDVGKRHLYKNNNRVKKAVVTSLDKNNPFEIEYEFEDYVHFSEIKFPVAVDKIRFTIKEVYKGDKWDDTCITAVITRWEE